MKISAKVIIAVLVVAIVELSGLIYFIANYHADNTPAYKNSLTEQELVGIALNDDAVKEYTSHLKYNISEVYAPVYAPLDLVHIQLGNNTTYWASLTVGVDPEKKSTSYVRLEGSHPFLPEYGILEKAALMNKTVNEYMGSQNPVLEDANYTQQYVIFDIGDMVSSWKRLKVGVDTKNDTVTYITDLGIVKTGLPPLNVTSKNLASNTPIFIK